MHDVLGRHVLRRGFCFVRHVCAWHLHGRQLVEVHVVSRRLVLGHSRLRLVHHVYVGLICGCGLLELRRVQRWLLRSRVVWCVLIVSCRHLLASRRCGLHHVHSWFLRAGGLDELSDVRRRQLLG